MGVNGMLTAGEVFYNGGSREASTSGLIKIKKSLLIQSAFHIHEKVYSEYSLQDSKAFIKWVCPFKHSWHAVVHRRTSRRTV